MDTNDTNSPKRAGLLDLVIVLLERKLFLIISMSLISIGAVLLTLIMPKQYQATGVIMRPESGLSSSLGSLVGDLPVGNLLKSFNPFDGGASNDQILAILESRRLADRTIDKFNLVDYFGFGKEGKPYFIEDVLKSYYEMVGFSEGSLGKVYVSVTDTSPQLCADMANFLISEADRINKELATESARQRRVFFEQRIDSVQTELDSAHARFAHFQIEHNYLDLDQQVSTTIDAIAQMEASAQMKQMEIDLLHSKYGNNVPKITELQREHSVMRRRIEHLLEKGNGELIISLKQAPKLGIEYADLYRDVKIKETLNLMVLQMYEQAKFKEIDDVPTIQVLEQAQVPQKRISPKRSITCIFIFFVGFLFMSAIVIFQKWYSIQRTNQTEVYRKMEVIRGHIPFTKK